MAQSLAEWRPEAEGLSEDIWHAVWHTASKASQGSAWGAATAAVRALSCPRVTDGLRETWEEFRRACTYEAHNECFYGPWGKCCEQDCPRLHPPTGCGSETVSTKPRRARRGK